MYQVSDQTGRRFVITGANSGTGKEAARRIAAAGGHVVMAVRTEDKGHAAAEEIRRDVPVRVARGAPHRPGRSRQRACVRRRAPVRRPAARRADQQRGRDGGAAADDDRRRLRAPVRQQLPRPVRVDQSASAAAALVRVAARDHDGQRSRQLRQHPLPRSAVRRVLQRRQGLLAVEAGRPVDGPAPGAHRAGSRVEPGEHHRPSRLHAHQPAVLGTEPRSGEEAVQPDASTFRLLPSQDVVSGTEPLLFAATDPDVRQGAYYGPVASAAWSAPPRRRSCRAARGVDLAASLWSVAEDLTGTTLPVEEFTPSR